MDRTLPPLPEPVALYKLTVTGYLHETAPTTAASNLADGDYLLYAAPQPAPARPCTCNPGDNPPQPCAQQYALLECRAAASEKPRAADHGAPAAQHQHKGYIAGLPGWNYPDAGDPLPAGGDKCLLLTKGGVCIVGAWSNGVGLLAWSPMPKRDKTKEAAHGIAATESHSWPKR